MWPNVYSNGLKYVHQLFQNQAFKSDEEAFQQCGLDKLRFNAIKTALPGDWKEFFIKYSSSTYMPIPPHNYQTAIVVESFGTSRQIYQYIVEDEFRNYTKWSKWNQEIGDDFCEDVCVFNTLHLDTYKVTNIAKYRSFQYRILQRGK